MPIQSNNKALAPARERYKQDITLISKGFVNPAAFPAGKITVFPWDSSAEEFLLGRAKRGGKKETIIFDLFPKLCNLNGCNPKAFLAGEAVLVVLVSRSLTRNSQLSLDFECPECDHKWSENVSVPSGLEMIGEKAEDYPGFDIILLPESKDMVKIHPMTVQDQLTIINRPAELRRPPLTDGVANILGSVDAIAPTEELLLKGEGKPDHIMEAADWYTRLSPRDCEALAEGITNSNPQLGTVLSVQCPECTHSFKFHLSLDEAFFRTSGNS